MLIIAILAGFAVWYAWQSKQVSNKQDRSLTDNQPPASSHGGPVTDYVSFIDNLRASGVSVKPVSEVSNAGFSVKGQQISANGQEIQVYEYPDAAAAKNDRTNNNAIVDWPPGTNLYRKNKIVILLPPGTSPELVKIVASLAG